MKKLKLVAILAMVSFIFFMGCKKDDYKAIVGVCPLVNSTNPVNNATGVPLNKIITATFNEKMNPATFTQTSFTIQGATALKESTAVSGTVSFTDSTATLIPSSPLLPYTTYTGTIKSSVRDLMGNFLQEDYVWTFNTDASPTVSSTDPVNNGTGVVLDKIISATFSVPMDPLSITATTFTIKQGTTIITGTIVYNGITASFTPTIALTPNSIYTGTITTGAKNVAGTPLVSNFVWTFTTDLVPTVISTDPANNAIGVVLDKTVSVTFSVPMDPLTITSASFTLKQGTTSVAGVVSYSGSTASFIPSSPLNPNATYTGTITTGAKNVGGIQLANNYVWTFSTGLSPTVISTEPANNAIGVALDKTVKATYSEPMDPLTITSATFTLKQGTTIVAGEISYSGLTATFIPSSPLNPNATYTGTITTGAKNVGGIQLANNYVWTFTTGLPPTVISTDPTNNAIGVAPDKTVAATYSVPMDVLTITSSTFTLKQGTTSVAGVVSYSGSTAFFNPTIDLLPGAIYTATITKGAKNLSGTAIANNYVWTFTTAIAIPPTVISTDPLNNATNVSINKTVAATFSVSMDELTITSATFTLKQGTTSIAGLVSYSGSTAFFNPSVNLLPGTLYTATITTGAMNLDRTAMANNYVWTFTTSSDIVITPTVILTNPLNNATNVAFDKTVAAIFSVPMNVLTISSSTFTLKQGTTSIAGEVSYSGSTAFFNPTSDLLPGLLYTASITTGAKNLVGTPIENDYVWTFTTALTIPPSVISTDPINNEIDVVKYKRLAATFNMRMNSMTINSSTFTLKQGTTSISGSVYYASSVAYFQPDVLLSPGTTYTATITTGAKNMAGTPLENDYVWSFITISPNIQYSLILTAVNGIVSKNPNLLLYDYGTIVELTATPNPGYSFTSWSGDALGSVNPLIVTMDANKNISANFTEDTIIIINPANPLGVDLGSAGNFAILAGSGISNTGVTTHIVGDVGSFPTATINGLLPGNVDGILYTSADPLVDQAKLALTAAYNDAQSRSLNAISLPGQLGGLTFAPGLYVNSSTSGISGTGANGILTLDAGGDANAVWIFKMGSTLITDTGTSIVLAGGAQAKNIYWSVGSSATLGTNSIFYGNILADQSITLTTGATLHGRALTRIAAVTLDSSTIIKP